MRRGTRWWVRAGWVVAAIGLVWGGVEVWAQAFLATIPAPELPNVPPNGAWGEVIMANSKWLVIQNHLKQQFPVLIDNTHIRQFLVRWPIAPRDLTPDMLVEAIGADLGSNMVQVDHVDVFQGADQSLVAPTMTSVISGGRPVTAIDPTFQWLMSPWDIGAQATMQYGWVFPARPTATGIPARWHAVGSVLSRNPLQLSVPGNNVARVVPGASGSYTMTQVTFGSASFLQKGDLVFLVPIGLNAKSLFLQQLVLYKKMPRADFAP